MRIREVVSFFLAGFSVILTVFLNFSENEQKFILLWYDTLHNWKNSGTFGKKFRQNKKVHFDKEMRG